MIIESNCVYTFIFWNLAFEDLQRLQMSLLMNYFYTGEF